MIDKMLYFTNIFQFKSATFSTHKKKNLKIKRTPHASGKLYGLPRKLLLCQTQYFFYAQKEVFKNLLLSWYFSTNFKTSILKSK